MSSIQKSGSGSAVPCAPLANRMLARPNRLLALFYRRSVTGRGSAGGSRHSTNGQSFGTKVEEAKSQKRMLTRSDGEEKRICSRNEIMDIQFMTSTRSSSISPALSYQSSRFFSSVVRFIESGFSAERRRCIGIFLPSFPTKSACNFLGPHGKHSTPYFLARFRFRLAEQRKSSTLDVRLAGTSALLIGDHLRKLSSHVSRRQRLAPRSPFRSMRRENKSRNEYVLPAFSLWLVRVAELDSGATERNDRRNVRPTEI